MTTDSSSGTLPASSRVTIDSSSSIARSKLSFLTSTLSTCLGSTCLESTWVFSAILVSRMRHSLGAESKTSMRTYCGGNSRAHQCGDVRRDRLFQALQIITALEHRNDPSAGAAICDIHQLAGDPAEILRLQIERGQRIAVVRVEA